MRCTPIANGFVCGARPRRRRCSTPGCRQLEALTCDAAVERDAKPPKVGDTRLHREAQVVFYVRAVVGGCVTISTARPGSHGTLQSVRIEDWHAKSDPTCDKPICSSCALQVRTLDLCREHAEQHQREACTHPEAL